MDVHNSGLNFGNRIVNTYMQEFKRENRGKDLTGHQCAIRCLHAQCERANRTLSSPTQATIEINSLFRDADYADSLFSARFGELVLGHALAGSAAVQDY
eukprot:UN2470